MSNNLKKLYTEPITVRQNSDFKFTVNCRYSSQHVQRVDGATRSILIVNGPILVFNNDDSQVTVNYYHSSQHTSVPRFTSSFKKPITFHNNSEAKITINYDDRFGTHVTISNHIGSTITVMTDQRRYVGRRLKPLEDSIESNEKDFVKLTLWVFLDMVGIILSLYGTVTVNSIASGGGFAILALAQRQLLASQIIIQHPNLKQVIRFVGHVLIGLILIYGVRWQEVRAFW